MQLQLPSTSRLLHYCLLVSVLVLLVQIIQAAPNVTVPAVIAFGDSIVDPGNNNDLLTVAKCDFHPYGRDFVGGKPTGRFSNGKIPTDLLVQALGIKEFLPAYLDPGLEPADLLTGVSFASGASGYDPLTAKTVAVIGMSDQLNLFKEYIEKLKVIAGEQRTKSIIRDAVYIVVNGNNDLSNTYFHTPFRNHTYSVATYTDLMVTEASNFVQELYSLGARRIAVFGVPPIGCLPAERTLGGGLQRQCVEEYNQASILFNSKLSFALDNLSANFQNAKAIYVDIYFLLLDLINNPTASGFEVVDRGCCGTGKLEASVLCNKLTPSTCRDASKYLFWDSFHPSQKGYKALVDPLIPKIRELIDSIS